MENSDDDFMEQLPDLRYTPISAYSASAQKKPSSKTPKLPTSKSKFNPPRNIVKNEKNSKKNSFELPVNEYLKIKALEVPVRFPKGPSKQFSSNKVLSTSSTLPSENPHADNSNPGSVRGKHPNLNPGNTALLSSDDKKSSKLGLQLSQAKYNTTRKIVKKRKKSMTSETPGGSSINCPRQDSSLSSPDISNPLIPPPSPLPTSSSLVTVEVVSGPSKVIAAKSKRKLNALSSGVVKTEGDMPAAAEFREMASSEICDLDDSFCDPTYEPSEEEKSPRGISFDDLDVALLLKTLKSTKPKSKQIKKSKKEECIGKAMGARQEGSFVVPLKRPSVVKASDTHASNPPVSIAEEVCGGAACGWCLSCPGLEMLQLCSACSIVAYCGSKCQGESWPTHNKVCKNLKGETWGQKVELVGQMIAMARSSDLKRKLGKSAPSVVKASDTPASNPPMSNKVGMSPGSDSSSRVTSYCSKCGKIFVNLKSCVKHERKCGSVCFMCNICQGTFKSVRYLKVHIKKIHDKVSEFDCDQCDSKFRTLAKLSSHKKDHNVVCDQCTKPFKNRDSLKSHIRKSHIKPKGKKTWYCYRCPRTFNSGRGLRYHAMVHKLDVDGPTGQKVVSEETVIEERDIDTEGDIVITSEAEVLSFVVVEDDKLEEDPLAENIIF